MKKNYLFLGFAIPDKEMKKAFEDDRYPAIQTHKFNWNLIKGLEHSNRFDFTYISTRPVSDFPHYKKKIVKKKSWEINVLNKYIEINEIPFVNISLAKIITRFLSGLYYSFKKYHKVKNKSGIIVYSVHVPFMLIGYIISKIYRIDLIGVWTDPPSVNNRRDSFLKRSLRKLELSISKFLMKRFTKVIVLTKYLAEDFAPNKPYIVIEGIIDTNEINNYSEKEFHNEVKVVYTGSLSKKYGIENIVKGFCMIKNKNISLEIYGRGDYETELLKICKKYPQIRYKGFIPNEEILKVQRQSDFLINARDPKEEFVKYSFPSKTLEYMLSGTPLITTMLPGIPEEYSNYVVPLKDNAPETIADTILSMVQLDKKTREEIGMKALRFARSKSYINQGNKIIEFISTEN